MKIDELKKYQTNNLQNIMGGQVTYTYRDTTMANGGHDEDQLTHQDFETYLDGLYDCTAGKFITMNW